MSYSQQKKKGRPVWHYILGVGVLLLIVFAVMKGRKSDTGTEVTAEASQRRTIVETVSGTGKIYPETEVAITSDVSGTIVEIYVKEGDSVREGQLLCKINADLLEPVVERSESAVSGAKAQVETLRANQKQAQAQLDNAKTALDRQEKLFKDGVISNADVENARAAFKSAEAAVESAKQNILSAEFNVNSAQASVKESRENLKRTIIYAPMNGVVSKVSKKKGEQVVGTIQMAGTEIMRIANLNALEVRVNVSENEILRVNEGDTADIEVDAYLGRKFKGVVTQVSNSANNLDGSGLTSLSSDKVTDFTVKVHLLESSYKDLLYKGAKSPFLPGMSASADIRTQVMENVTTVPIQAVTTREEDSTVIKKAKKLDSEIREVVFVVSGDTVALRTVKTGIQDNQYIRITEGLQDGEMVVTGPYTLVARKLKVGQKIKIVKEEELYKKENATDE